MYVITNKDDIVLAGPIQWSPGIIIHAIETETGEDFTLLSSDYNKVPYEPVEGIKIRFAEINDPGHNSIFEDRVYVGWTFDDTKGTLSYSKKDKDISFVKNELKKIVSSVRWSKENDIIQIKWKDINLKISAERDKRSTLYQKYVLSDDDSTVTFKIDGQWFDMTKKDLKYLITKIDQHVQDMFDWELDLFNKIDQINDIQSLKLLYENNIFPKRES